MIDDEIDSDNRSPIGTKVFELYGRLHEVVDVELMKFNEEELQMLRLIYGENFQYPIHEHIDQMMSGTPEGEVLH